MIRKSWGVGLLLVTALLFSGCSSKPEVAVAAPLGEKGALEKLEKAWKTVSDDRLAVSPTSLTGAERKDFLERVFAEAGYDYDTTLLQMASQGFDKHNKLHSDMAELLLMPHRNPRIPQDPATFYSVDELKAVAVIERELNKP